MESKFGVVGICPACGKSFALRSHGNSGTDLSYGTTDKALLAADELNRKRTAILEKVDEALGLGSDLPRLVECTQCGIVAERNRFRFFAVRLSGQYGDYPHDANGLDAFLAGAAETDASRTDT